MNKKAKYKITYKKLITYEFLAVIDKDYPKNNYELNFIDGEDLNLDWMGWGVKSVSPKKEIEYKSISIDYEPIKKDEPEEGKQYLLTGAPGTKCIANGNTWKESHIKK